MKVEFEEHTHHIPESPAAPSGIAGFLIRKGVVRNVAQANTLLVFIVVMMIIIIFIQHRTPSVPEAVPLPETIELVQ